VAGLSNVAASLRGAQLTGGMNAAGRGAGLQLALGYNRAYSELAGIQIAAVNIGGVVSGAQVGVVNIARRVRGMQIGLVNVADHADAPIGAVSWMRQGERAVEIWAGEALAAAGVRLGTRRVYSLVGLSSGPLADGAPWGPVVGAGVKIRLAARTGLLLDALAHTLLFDGIGDVGLLGQARARVAYDLTERLALALGATWNAFVSSDVDGEDLPLGPDTLDRSGDTAVRQWPGLSAAVSVGW